MRSATIVPFPEKLRADRRRGNEKKSSYSQAQWREIEEHLWRASQEVKAAFDIFCAARQKEEP